MNIQLINWKNLPVIGLVIMFKASENIILREIAGESILVPVGPLARRVHGMISLSESGRILWDCLQRECAEEELVNALLSEYDVDEQTAREDVTAFLEKLSGFGLLQGE